MITVKIDTVEATFEYESWKCKDKATEVFLNDWFDIDEISVSDAYRESKYDKSVTGIDGVVLDSIAFLQPEIIEYIPRVIKEEKGTVI